MKQDQARRLVPEAVIIAAALFGAWMLFVAPAREELAVARAAYENAAQYSRIAGDPSFSRPSLDAAQREIDLAIDEIDRRSKLALDQTTLQARLMAIGEANGVRIDRVSPARTRKVGDGKADDHAVSFDIACTGEYRNVAALIGDIEGDLGLTRVDEIGLRPGNDSATVVRATLRTTHFAFDTSPPPAEIEDEEFD